MILMNTPHAVCRGYGPLSRLPPWVVSVDQIRTVRATPPGMIEGRRPPACCNSATSARTRVLPANFNANGKPLCSGIPQ